MAKEKADLSVVNRKLVERGATAAMVARGYDLGLAMGCVTDETLPLFLHFQYRAEVPLDANMNLDFDSEPGKQKIFCGSAMTEGGIVARAFVRQGLWTSDDGWFYFTVGVESSPAASGISKYWFEVESQQKDTSAGSRKMGRVECSVDGQIILSGGDEESVEISRLKLQSREAVMTKIAQSGIPTEILTLSQSVRWIGAVMTQFAQHNLGNPYRQWTEKSIWQALKEVNLEKYEFGVR